MFDHSKRTNLEAYQTYSIQVLATPKATLMSQVTENITDVRVFSTGMAFYLAMVIHERLKLSFTSFSGRPFLPPACNQAAQELSEDKEGEMVIAPEYYLCAKTADALTQLWTSGNSR